MKLIRNLIAFICYGLVFSACTRDKLIAPENNDLYGPVKVIDDFDISNESVNFQNGEFQGFFARFNRRVQWQITLTGLSSLKSKVISDSGAAILPQFVRWDGKAEVPPGFPEEEVEAILSLPNHPGIIQKKRFKITGKRNENFGDAVVIADFSKGWDPRYFTVSDGDEVSFDSITSINATPTLLLRGTEKNGNFYVGQFTARVRNARARDIGSFPIPTTVTPSNLYLNFYVYQPFWRVSGVEITIYENEIQDKIPGWQSGRDDMFRTTLFGLSGPGWTLISRPYSDFGVPNGYGSSDTTEITWMGTRNPDRLQSVEWKLLVGPGNTGSLNLALPTFTIGQPFQY